MTDLQYQQVLNNLAFLSQDPFALPFHLSIKTGSTQISDTGTARADFDLHTFTGSVPSLTGSLRSWTSGEQSRLPTTRPFACFASRTSERRVSRRPSRWLK